LILEPKIEVVVLDLFDTIVKWDPERLPRMQWNDREIHSTVPWFISHLKDALDDRFDHQRALATYFEVLHELNEIRERDAVEISCLERFIRVLARLNYGSDEEILRLAGELTRIHMAGVRRVTWAPPERVAALHEIAPHYRMAVLSNFDDSETGYQIVEDTGAAHLFEAVIISADLGLRKPHPDIFKRMMEMMKVEDPRTILFVGDTPRFDITGPHRAGMRTVWLSEGKEPLTPEIPTPDFVIGNLSELPALLRTLE
jgi:FMN phosphatase YigB (HAD superfamily)